jgi:hypothetical protein
MGRLDRRETEALLHKMEEGMARVRRRIADPDTEDPVHLPKRPKERKQRIPWEKEETEKLFTLVCNHGPKWSLFEQRFSGGTDLLSNRDQGALKDKARNILRAYIQRGQEGALYKKYPRWKLVTAGAARRGVHGYLGVIPNRRKQYETTKNLLEIEDSDEELDSPKPKIGARKSYDSR